MPGHPKRLATATRLILHAIHPLATHVPSHTDQSRLIDATPLPCGTTRETVNAATWPGGATYGYRAPRGP